MKLNDIPIQLLFENVENIDELIAPRSAIDAYKRGKRKGETVGKIAGGLAGEAIPIPLPTAPLGYVVGKAIGGRIGGRRAAAKEMGTSTGVKSVARDVKKVIKGSKPLIKKAAKDTFRKGKDMLAQTGKHSTISRYHPVTI